MTLLENVNMDDLEDLVARETKLVWQKKEEDNTDVDDNIDSNRNSSNNGIDFIWIFEDTNDWIVNICSMVHVPDVNKKISKVKILSQK